MADVKMPDSVPCKFDEKGWAPCKKPSTNGWCSKHENITCESCGQHAVRSCDAGMGGLACGAPLCKTCQHGLEGGHVTAEIYKNQQAERRTFEETGQESERMLAARGVPGGLPRHLKALLEGDRTGWTSRPCWALELKHGLMGFFPAIQKGTKIMVLVPDKELIFRIWLSLEPRDSRLVSLECMVNEAGTVAYVMRLGSDHEKTQSLPLKLYTADEVEELFAADEAPFQWAPGLFGADISKRQLQALIEQAREGQAV